LTLSSSSVKGSAIPAFTGPFTKSTGIAFIGAAAFHVMWQACIAALPSMGVSVKTSAPEFFVLLSSSQQSAEYRAAVRILSQSLGLTSVYFLTIIAAAAVAGRICRFEIERYRLDFRWPALRFKPPWYYVLNGDDYGRNRPILIQADLLVEVNNKPVLYSGFVYKIWFDDNGQLDTIFIENVKREWMRTGEEEATAAFWMKLALETSNSEAEGSIDANRQEAKKPQTADPHGIVITIPSDIFAVKFSEVKNINIRYLEISEQAKVPSAGESTPKT